ncbi:MAG TPA: glycosyltransferase [Candidatus Nanopelagicales bacterium]|nr:glycosyltransferase [Candidatus Nanopelagicales bacterium]
MRILMLVATSVATDTRVLREAQTLVDAGHDVHIIGKDVPLDFVAPQGISVSSAGASSVFRPAGTPSAAGRRLSAPQRAARWALLPQHRNQAFRSWAAAAGDDARGRQFDVVHAHDFTALEVGAALATERQVPYVYDTHELWLGRQRQYRPTPLQDRREAATEARLGGAAAAVITVGDGVAAALRVRYGWTHVTVVRNSFPARDDDGSVLPETPSGAVYAGRVDAHRELETVLGAAPLVDLPFTLVGPSDDVWVGRNAEAIAATGTELLAALPVEEVTALLRRQGLALVTHSDRFESHLLALPNKLFHAVHAGVPVIATDVPELAAIVRRHDLGETYRPGDPRGLAAAVGRALDRYPGLVASVAAAAEELSWPADAAALRGVYDRIQAGSAR